MWEKLWRRRLDWGYRVGRLSLEGTTVEAKRGEEVGFDGHRRRKGTKVHAVVTAQGVPVGVEVTSARKHEATVFSEVLGTVRVGRRKSPAMGLMTAVPCGRCSAAGASWPASPRIPGIAGGTGEVGSH